MSAVFAAPPRKITRAINLFVGGPLDGKQEADIGGNTLTVVGTPRRAVLSPPGSDALRDDPIRTRQGTYHRSEANRHLFWWGGWDQ